MAGEETLGVEEYPRVLDHVEKERAAGLHLLGSLEDGRERDRWISRLVRLQQRIEPGLDRQEFLDAMEPAAREVSCH